MMATSLEPANDDTRQMAAELRDRIERDVRSGTLRPLSCESTADAGDGCWTRSWHELPGQFEVTVLLGDSQVPGCLHPDDFEAIPHRLFGIEVEAEFGMEVFRVTCDARLVSYRETPDGTRLTYVCELA